MESDTIIFQPQDDELDHIEQEKVENATRGSMYVEFFEEMVKTCTSKEPFLFTSKEHAFFQNYHGLSYSARYLLIRLSLRKPGRWHRLDDITKRYANSLRGNPLEAMKELCSSDLVPRYRAGKPVEVIDLTLNEEDLVPQSPVPSLPADPSNSIGDTTFELDLSTFAVDEEHMSLSNLLSCLSLEELKTLGKQFKVYKSGMTVSSLTEALLANSSKQSSLTTFVTPPKLSPKNKDTIPLRQLTLNLGTKAGTSQGLESRLRALILGMLGGKCIRIESGPMKLFQRLNLVFFRATVHTPQLMTPSILTKARKRYYPSYEYNRTIDIFPSREDLLDYEKALEIEAQVDNHLEVGFKIPGKGKKTEGEQVVAPRIKAAQNVKRLWQGIWERWKQLVMVNGNEKERGNGLERFECGHVLTRIVYKAASCLGTLKEYDLEVEILTALLEQKRWRQGRRGGWYDRLGLLLMTYGDRSNDTLLKARRIIICGLDDPSTHLVYRYRLARRLMRLEKRLNLPDDEHTWYPVLRNMAKNTTLNGVRLISRDKKNKVETEGTPGAREASVLSIISRGDSKGPETLPPVPNPAITEKVRWTGKSLWRGRNGEEVNVETLVLQHYQNLGFQGFHSEGRIVTTLFGLLFWDILFHPVPGAFETPYQSAPLDLLHDTFNSSRKPLIEKRLEQLESGEARTIMEHVDGAERPTATWCVGVRWDLFSADQLLEIVDCIGGRALAAICKLLCEDYGGRCSGIPDLFVWKAGTCKFIEVKGPGDSLQENQKIWIDVLVGAGMTIEVCRVEEEGVTKKKPAKKSKTSVRESKPRSQSELESEDGIEVAYLVEDADISIRSNSKRKVDNGDDDAEIEYIESRKKKRLSDSI